jgi:hypothetical protein
MLYAVKYDDLYKQTRKALKDWGQIYYEHYSTSLSKPRELIVTGYEACYAYVMSVDVDNARKNLNKAFMVAALASFVGSSIIGAWVVPTIALSLSKIYLLSHGLDWLAIKLADHSKILARRDDSLKREAEFWDTTSKFIKLVSDTVLISGIATTLAAPIVGVLSHIHVKLVYDILQPASNAMVYTLGFEFRKGKDLVNTGQAGGIANQDYLLKAVINFVGYKLAANLLGDGFAIGLLSFVSVRSFTEAFMLSEKDIAKVPENLWKGLNSSIGFCAQYFMLGLSDAMISSMATSTTALSAVVMKAVNLSVIEKTVVPLKAYYEGVQDKVEPYCKDVRSIATEISEYLYGHTSRVLESKVDTKVLSLN